MTNKGTAQPNYDASTFILHSYNTYNDALTQVFLGFDENDSFVSNNFFPLFNQEDENALVGLYIEFDKNSPEVILLDIKETGDSYLERIYLELNSSSTAVQENNFLAFAVNPENEIVGIIIDFKKDDVNTLDRIFVDCFTGASFAHDNLFLRFRNDRVQIEEDFYGNE
ncbi:hypothetical protein [Fundicoccus culcitae]|uniref:Uncharacterized protein n=1 Tax=Fundicoccus culcitae TaxID=2969821 RepID=A0ABY5P3F5_9LACT|nr:hypothetical protein [Fundicoccus culcitae]UUX33264.1 hypothetical protein NRE15_10155 [Fundicoccus culcitae]